MIDCLIFTLALLAAMSAECIPLMLAGVVTVCQDKKEELPGATNTEQPRVEQKSRKLYCFIPSLPKNEGKFKHD